MKQLTPTHIYVRVTSQRNIMADPIHITLEFNDIKALFVAPDYDPFDKNSYEQSGLRYHRLVM